MQISIQDSKTPILSVCIYQERSFANIKIDWLDTAKSGHSKCY